MIKKVKKNICIIFFIIIFIFINFSNVYAEYEMISKDKISSYTTGTKMILIKNAYKYNITYEKVWLGGKKAVAKKDSDELYFKKGEVVEFTGEHASVSEGLGSTLYLEVKQKEKKAYIHYKNLGIYKSTRPKNIKEFINTYGIAEIKTEEKYVEMIEKYSNDAKAQGEDVDYYINQANGNLTDITHMKRDKREKYKRDLEGWYKDTTEIKYIEGDSLFLVVAYMYAYKYQTLLTMDEMFGEDGGEDTDWAEQFDKAYKAYQKAEDDTKKNAALQQMKDAWQRMPKTDKTKEREKQLNAIEEKEKEEYEKAKSKATIYKAPDKTSSGDSSEESLDDMVDDADKFVSKGAIKYNSTTLQNFSKTFYNILLTVGVFVAVIVGATLGIKLMVSGIEEKADVKKMLLIYLIGCIVVFGGFAIWKLVVDIMQNVWG